MRGLGRNNSSNSKAKEFQRLFLGIVIFVALYTISSSRFLLSTSYYYNDIQFSTPTLPSNQQEQLYAPLHASFAISGNHPGVLAEFEVALKSVLLNAPLERKLILHILADEEGYNGLKEVYTRTDIPTWITRNQVEIHNYDVSPLMKMLEKRIGDVFQNMGPDFKWWHAVSIHTMGTFYRLIAHLVIPTSSSLSSVGGIQHLLYIDTDVVVLANLEGLWNQTVLKNPDALFHWGSRMNAGFIVLNIPRVEEIWTLAAESPLKNISETKKQDANDQLVFMSVNITHPDKVNIIEPGWEMAITNLWMLNQDELDKLYPDTGMLHYNGGSSSKSAYFEDENGWVNKNAHWVNGKYYVTLPWTWARYQARTLVRTGSNGYAMKICSWGRTYANNNTTLKEGEACLEGMDYFYRNSA